MLKKLANGELSLKLTFWVFGLLVYFIFFIFTSITHAGVLRYICPAGKTCSDNLIVYIFTHFIGLMMRGTQSGIMFYLIAHLLLSTSFIFYIYITLAGLWKSAASYEGAAFWAWSAKIIMVGIALASLKSIF
ncbi:MAG: hypothetical protein IJ532_07065 [Alphaproteobacteria bacterium]|nr:hypothetical protein [Alphaproteobacteria bacterium]